MRAAKAARLGINLLVSIAAIGLSCIIAVHLSGHLEAIAKTNSQTKAEAPPIPPDGPLGRPKSLDQAGLPSDAVRAAAPADNPQTPERVALGERLFFDGRLSVDGTVACSTCHDPARAFTDGREVSIGVRGLAGQRNAPTVLNALFNSAQFWDGRAKTLEEQAGLPIINPVEMGQPTMEAAAAKIAAIPEYAKEFQRVFARPTNPDDLERAIAAYERTQVSFDSPFDHFIAGNNHAISAAAKQGWELFNTKARCNKCHALSEEKRDPAYFMDRDFHNIGIGIIRHNVVAEACKAETEVNSGNAIQVDQVAIQSEMSVLGRFLLTKKDADIASFKTPGLRNVLITAPYFHDGSQATLWDVMDHYNKGDGIKNPWLDQDMQPLALTEPEIDDLVEFLAALTSSQYQQQGIKNSTGSAPSRAPTARSATPPAPSGPNPSSPSLPAIARLPES